MSDDQTNDQPTTDQVSTEPKPKKVTRHAPKGKAHDDAPIVKKTIEFTLTQSERAEAGEHAAAAKKELDEMEEQYAAVKKNWSEKLKRVAGLVSHHLNAISKGVEDREVDCAVIKNFDENTVEFWHKGKKVSDRAMTPEDRQEAMKIADQPTPSSDNVTSIRATRSKLVQRQADEHRARMKKDNDDDIGDVIREETSKKTKKSSVDPNPTHTDD